MAKIRLLLLLLTFLVVGVGGTLLFLYAKGFRLNTNTLEISESGLLVIKSNPDGASIFINGELKTATNATLSLPPQSYDVLVKKEGYLEWKKRLEVKAGEVTEATAHLFRVAPSLSAITFSGVTKIVPSFDSSKIAFSVPPDINPDASGLWVMEIVDLPLGFSREPRKITDGNLKDADFIWSPDGRQILLKTQRGIFLLDASTFTPQGQLINVANSLNSILTSWDSERDKKLNAQLKKLPEELANILQKRSSKIVFSPDEDMVLYQASSSATIPEGLIKPLPGASTQKQERDIKKDRTYIYDIKEDRNFFITEGDVELNGWIDYQEIIQSWSKPLAPTPKTQKIPRSLSWYPSSRHVILAEESKVTLMDYDGTNRQIVYSGSFIAPHTYPTLSTDRLIILTNFGSNSTVPNLYSLSIK